MEILLRKSKLEQTLNKQTNQPPFQIKIKRYLNRFTFGLLFLVWILRFFAVLSHKTVCRKPPRLSKSQLPGATIRSLLEMTSLASILKATCCIFICALLASKSWDTQQKRNAVKDSRPFHREETMVMAQKVKFLCRVLRERLAIDSDGSVLKAW